jgi:hypothetical protein
MRGAGVRCIGNTPEKIVGVGAKAKNGRDER